MVIVKPCAVCGAASNFRCSGCKTQHYCSKAHQKSDWKARHKVRCRPFTVELSETLGRHLVATKDLPPGTPILREDPLAVAPKQWTRPICLGCFRYIRKNSTKCSTCGWPMCSAECARTPQHVPECSYTCRRKLAQQKGDGEQSDSWKISIKEFDHYHPMYHSVALLRCLYLRDHNKTAWDKLMNLESHCELRKQMREREGPSAGDDEWVIQFTKNFFNLDDGDAEDMRKIIGILTVNGHEVPLPQWMCQDGPVSSFVAVYHMASMLEHNCVPNCRKSFPSLGEIEIRTTTFVSKGERLSICYTDPFWGTLDRKKHLYASKFFDCNCLRCEDATELGTFLSGIKCLMCTDGYCVPVKNSSSAGGKLEENLELYSWECWGKANKNARRETGCGSVMTFTQANQILQALGSKLSEIEEDNINETQDYLRRNSDAVLHKNHQYLVGARLGLLRLLQARMSAAPVRLFSKDPPEIKLLECTSKELLEVVDILSPGMTEIRGILLYELYAKKVASVVETLLKHRQPRVVERDVLVRLQEAVDILSIESAESASGVMADQGRVILGQLDELSDLILPQS